MSKKKKFAFVILIALALSLVGARLYLPYWIKDYANTQINNLRGYSGNIQDIDISLWRGAYQIKGLQIYKTSSGSARDPFVAARLIDLSIEWKALLHGSIVSEVDIYNIDVNFKKSQTGEGANWSQLLKNLSPFDINRMSLHKGRIAYIDRNADPDVNVYVDITTAEVTNLRNIEDKNVALPSNLQVTGKSVGGGNLRLDGRVNVLTEIPDFDISSKLDGASLVAFNDYAKKFAGIDFESGTIGIYTELAAASGRALGYVKLIATDISFLDLEKGDDDVIDVIWESMVSVFVDLFKNQRTDQFALRIPIEGSLDKPEQDGWSAFISIFENAFGKAFLRDTDGSIRFSDLLQRNEANSPEKP